MTYKSGPIKKFNAFLSYRRVERDQAAVRELLTILRHNSLRIWFDEDELRPGFSWQKAMELGIKNSSSGVVLLGSSGIGPWQDREVQAFLRLAVDCELPLIPVFLPGSPKQVNDIPIFLREYHWVDLRSGFTPESVSTLIWGITGQKRKFKSSLNQSLPKNIADYIAKRGHLVHKLKARDSTGRWAYYFILVEEELEQAFIKSIELGHEIVDLENYGKVIASCYGEKPSEAIKKMLKEKYGFDV